MISVQCAPFCQHRKQTKRANKDILSGKIVWGPVGIPWLLSLTSSACEMGKNMCSLHHPVGIWDTAHPWRVTDGVLLVKAVPMYISVSRCAIVWHLDLHWQGHCAKQSGTMTTIWTMLCIRGSWFHIEALLWSNQSSRITNTYLTEEGSA